MNAAVELAIELGSWAQHESERRGERVVSRAGLALSAAAYYAAFPRAYADERHELGQRVLELAPSSLRCFRENQTLELELVQVLRRIDELNSSTHTTIQGAS